MKNNYALLFLVGCSFASMAQVKQGGNLTIIEAKKEVWSPGASPSNTSKPRGGIIYYLKIVVNVKGVRLDSLIVDGYSYALEITKKKDRNFKGILQKRDTVLVVSYLNYADQKQAVSKNVLKMFGSKSPRNFLLAKNRKNIFLVPTPEFEKLETKSKNN